jgi:hypothetical protein
MEGRRCLIRKFGIIRDLVAPLGATRLLEQLHKEGTLPQFLPDVDSRCELPECDWWSKDQGKGDSRERTSNRIQVFTSCSFPHFQSRKLPGANLQPHRQDAHKRHKISRVRRRLHFLTTHHIRLTTTAHHCSSTADLQSLVIARPPVVSATCALSRSHSWRSALQSSSTCLVVRRPTFNHSHSSSTLSMAPMASWSVRPVNSCVARAAAAMYVLVAHSLTRSLRD